ncbi:MAG: MOSC domain-containing protein [Pseudomonadota bacterium]
MKQIKGFVQSVHIGAEDVLSKTEVPTVSLALDGIVGDRHRGFTRVTWPGDKQAEGTTRRNERQWSAVSVEELKDISRALGLKESLGADDLGANLCLSGIDQLSRLPKGSLLEFPSGAVLMVEEYNPPCLDMGSSILEKFGNTSDRALRDTDFSKVAKLSRGIVGVVEVAGHINTGDEVVVRPWATPGFLLREAE